MMRALLHSPANLLTLLAVLAVPATALAQPDDAPPADATPEAATPSPDAPAADSAEFASEDPLPVDPNRARIGLGVRLRGTFVPKGMIEWFVERAPSGSSNLGFGLELTRRKKNFEVQLGLEYEKIEFADGIWIEKNKPIPANEVDYVEFDSFGWVTIEANFIYHSEFSKSFALRYGGGLGLGVLLGDVLRTDYVCVTSSVDSCITKPGGENNRTPYDLPPVFPSINFIFGAQIRPVDKVFINIETGIRTMPFVGTTVGYEF